MPVGQRGGSHPGERRGGRKKGSKNKRPRKVGQALVKLDQAEAEVRTILADGKPIDKLGKDRLAEIDEWAYSLAKLFAPEKDKEGRPYWRSPGDEARFERYLKLSAKCAAGRANYESPRFAAIAVAHQHVEDPDEGIDPHQKLIDMADRWIAAQEAERAPPLESHTEAETVATPPDPDDDCDGELA